MMGVVPLQEETRELLSLPTMQAPIEVATYKPGGALPREPNWGVPILDLQPPERREVNSCRLNHAVCSVCYGHLSRLRWSLTPSQTLSVPTGQPVLTPTDPK